MGTREIDKRTIAGGRMGRRIKDRRHLLEKEREEWICPRRREKIGIDRRLKDKWRWQSRERET